MPDLASSSLDAAGQLLFATLALQNDYLERRQFLDACALWSTRPEMALPDMLIVRGWLTLEAHKELERLLERKLSRHGGNAEAALAELASPRVAEALSAISDPHVRSLMNGAVPTLAPRPASLASTPPAGLEAGWNGGTDGAGASELNPDSASSGDVPTRWTKAQLVNLTAMGVLVLGIGVALATFLFPAVENAPKRKVNQEASERLKRRIRGLEAQVQADQNREMVYVVDTLLTVLAQKPTLVERLRQPAALPQAPMGLNPGGGAQVRQDALVLNNLSWYLVRPPGRPADAYHRARILVEEALRLEPKNGSYINTLGVVQYRLEKYREAQETLLKSLELNRRDNISHPADLAFLALAAYKLGDRQTAMDRLKELREAIEKFPAGGQEPGEAQAFLSEVESTVGAHAEREID